MTLSVDHTFTADDFEAVYGRGDDPSTHPEAREFFVGSRVRMVLLCGQQENSALQVMKTYLRRVPRYTTPESYNLRNWLHVTNPDAWNYPDLIRRFTRSLSPPGLLSTTWSRPQEVSS